MPYRELGPRPFRRLAPTAAKLSSSSSGMPGALAPPSSAFSSSGSLPSSDPDASSSLYTSPPLPQPA